MDLKELEALLELLSQHEVSDFNYRDGSKTIRLRLGPPAATVVHAAPMQMAPATTVAPAAAAVHQGAAATQAAAARTDSAPPKADANLATVESPMVGTFYRSPSPGAPSFVEVGSTVKPGQVVCIVEAMKLMNEIECEVAGTIAEILVENGHPVQFGQPLFRVRRA
jgi:acetyl-CoA carboxylase biotin carboxyl carrier protein